MVIIISMIVDVIRDDDVSMAVINDIDADIDVNDRYDTPIYAILISHI